MAEIVYLVGFITRAHSSGFENKTTRLFKNIEDASKYMIDIFQYYCIENGWDGDDLYIDSDMTEKAPEETAELAEKIFNVEALKTFLKCPDCGDRDTIYGPYSEFCDHIPFEMTFSCQSILYDYSDMRSILFGSNKTDNL